MSIEKELLDARLDKWCEEMAGFALPSWEELPQLALYMDQVLLLLRQYLDPLAPEGGEPPVTASIINNYVRLKVMPPPVKKKYTRVHLACLIILCMLKQSLSIASIRRLFPEEQDEESIRRLYEDFVAQCRTVTDSFVQRAGERALLPEGSGSAAATAALIAGLGKSLTEALLLPEESAKRG